MSPRPLIFISAVSRELRSARQLVANTLTFLGYQPVWQEIFGTESGDLRALLRQQIDQCKGVIHLVGQSYGAEPSTPDDQFGRVSYTQYEALYARHRGRKVWCLFIDETFPIDAHEPEPDELRELQAAYRRRLQTDTHVFHPLTSSEALEASVLKLRSDLTRLRRGVKQWAVAVVALLLLLVAGTFWLMQGQHRQAAVIQKQGEQVNSIVDHYQKMQQALVRLAEVETQSKQPGAKQSPEEQRTAAYGVLEKELGLPAGSLAKALPAFALELYNHPDTTPLMRARAAYALGKFDEAEKWSLEGAGQDRQAYETARRVQEDRRKHAIEGYVLAGQSAQKLIQFDKAMEHFREAEKLTDRESNPEDWAAVQYSIGGLLRDQGQYSSMESVLRNVVKVRTNALGPEHPDTLRSCNLLATALLRQGKYADAETQFREVVKLQEKILGSEHPDTLSSKHRLGNVLWTQGKYAEAETQFRDAIRLREKVLGPEHSDTLNSRNGLARTLKDQGKYAEAETRFRELIVLYERVLGPEYPETLGTRGNLANTLEDQAKYAEAEEQFHEIVRRSEKVLGPEHPNTLMARINLGNTLAEQGKYPEAEAQFQEIIKIEERVLGPAHPQTLQARGNLGETFELQGKYAEAEAQLREVITVAENVIGPEHPNTLDYYYSLASALEHQNKLQEAKEFARRAAEGARKALGPNHPSTQKYGRLLADLEARH